MTTSHKGHIEVYYWLDRLQSGRHGMWSYMKIPLHVKIHINHKWFTVAPLAYKDKKLVSLKILTDPSYIYSTDSKTVLR